jgi:hypothetical protein
VSVGTIQGVSYLSGGLKGCGTVFEFAGPHFSGQLYKNYPIGQDDLKHEITPDMKRIIESIQVQGLAELAEYKTKNFSVQYPETYTAKESGEMLIISGPSGKIIIGGFKPSAGHPEADEQEIVFQKIMYKDKFDPGLPPAALYYRHGDLKTESELVEILQTVKSLNE